MSNVLEDIRVIDLSRHISGPYCSSLLADMGAEVIRIERPVKFRFFLNKRQK